MTTDGAKEHIDQLSRKYLGHDYAAHNPEHSRVIVRVEPDAIDLRG